MITLFLPGMDGTGALFAPVTSRLAPGIEPRVCAYPEREALDYDALLETIVVPEGPFAIVGESFSGPLAIRLAHRYPDRVRALVLVASFAKNPSLFPSWMVMIAAFFMRFALSGFFLRLVLLGGEASASDVRSTRASIERVAPSVMATRLRAVARVDVSAELRATTMPLLYLAGRRDRLVGARPRNHIARLRRDARIELLDAPHMVLQQRPMLAAALLSEFLLDAAG